MKPLNTLLFVITVALILIIISLFFPKNGIRISDEISLRFLTPNDFQSKPDTLNVDISSIIDLSKNLQDTAIELVDSVITQQDTSIAIQKTDSIKPHEIKGKVHTIEFPENNTFLLDPFFASLIKLNADPQLIRILHYGDSQIEGDRITAYVRNALQKEFGGSGPGLLCAVQPYPYEFSIKQFSSPNWQRYITYGRNYSALGSKRFGLMASVCKFSSAEENAATGIISLTKSFKSYRSIRKYNQCQLIMGYAKEPFNIEFAVDDSVVYNEIHPAFEGVKVLKWKFIEKSKVAEIRINAKQSPEIYGVSLDRESGVAVDNIPMRGSSGLEFTKMDKELLSELYSQLNIKLIILQYGGNIAPSEATDYGFYGRSFYKQLALIKSIVPNVPVLVIGIADMAKKENDEFVSYPNIEKIRDEMKKAAFKANCGYWDLFEAMGGLNSIPQWVNADPPLAAKDYVHFSSLGARVVAEMFYNALYKEYVNFLKRK